jgi:hypothetical protein
MLLLRVAAALDAAKVPYSVLGGHAIAPHGVVRGTVDIGFEMKGLQEFTPEQDQDQGADDRMGRRKEQVNA